MNRTSIVVATVAAVTVWNGAGAGEIVAKIPGPDGSWNYASFDPVGHRILISRGDGVMAVDPATRKPSHIAQMVANHESGELSVIDTNNGSVCR
jgi:hypothetical protein